MCNSWPIVRIGQTLDFESNVEIEGTTEHLIWLPSGLAEDLAFDYYDAIAQHSQRILQGMSKSASALLSAPGSMKKDDARLSHDKGLIIDYPNMEFETARFKHNVRLCLTVCQPGTPSKLWFRAQCVGFRRVKNFVAPVEMTLGEMEEYFSEAKQLCGHGLPLLRNSYRNAIKQALRKKYEKVSNLSLKVKDEYVFNLFDSDRKDLASFFRKLEDGASFSGELLSETGTNSDNPHPALLIAQLVTQGAGTFEDAIYAIRDEDDKYEVLGHRINNSRQDPGIILKSVSKKQGKRLFTFFGAGFNADAHRRKRRPSQSTAYRLGAEVLANIVNQKKSTSPV